MDIISTEAGNRPQKRVRRPGVGGEKSPPDLRGRRKQELLAKKQDTGEKPGDRIVAETRERVSLRKVGMANTANSCQDGP